eukprot:3759971-Pyramimonas_sp.AAC.1
MSDRTALFCLSCVRMRSRSVSWSFGVILESPPTSRSAVLDPLPRGRCQSASCPSCSFCLSMAPPRRLGLS